MFVMIRLNYKFMGLSCYENIVTQVHVSNMLYNDENKIDTSKSNWIISQFYNYLINSTTLNYDEIIN